MMYTCGECYTAFELPNDKRCPTCKMREIVPVPMLGDWAACQDLPKLDPLSIRERDKKTFRSPYVINVAMERRHVETMRQHWGMRVVNDKVVTYICPSTD